MSARFTPHDERAAPVVGMVLSGGGARGFAHIGTLRALERHGLEVQVWAGTSIGAVIGALAAAGYRADDLLALARSVSWRDVFDLSLRAGMIKGDKLHALLAEHLPTRFEDLDARLAVTCTDIESGEEIVLTSGDLIKAVRASACFPGAFEPVQYLGRTLADGGICNNLPVDALATLNADVTIASDVTPPRRAAYHAPTDDPRSWWERVVATVTLEQRTPMAAVSLRATDIMMRLLTDAQYVHHPADLRIVHALPTVRVESFWDLEAVVEAGEAEAERVLSANQDWLQRIVQREPTADGAVH
ncbi:MAG: patatin-like phospholipase family protein [Trueperaceae bacterium]|nr:MAG: patatin-like phospholipase family protein [Trueperaceae bacterium]